MTVNKVNRKGVGHSIHIRQDARAKPCVRVRTEIGFHQPFASHVQRQSETRSAFDSSLILELQAIWQTLAE